MVIKLLAIASFLFVTGCYVEDVESRAQYPRSERTPGSGGELELNGVKRACSKTQNTGCFEGHVTAVMDVVVDGKSFFDADDLANRFHEVVQIKSKTGEQLERDVDYKIELLTPFDNKTFSREFSVFIKGERTEAISVRSQGKFFINKMPEGEYDLRVQRPVRFALKRLTTDSDQSDEVPSPSKIYCATLYQDYSFEVFANEKSESQVFDNFQLYITDVECEDTRTGGVLTP